MSDIPKLLLDSLNPHTRKQAEQSLEAYSRQPAFVVHLLRLVLDATQNGAVRLAASVYLKNMVKLGWLDDVCRFTDLLSDTQLDLTWLPPTKGRVSHLRRRQGGAQAATRSRDDRPFQRERQGHPRADRRVRLFNSRA